MKHIFVVHSPLTYVVSLGVIYKEQIKEEDVIIISTNYYQKEPIEVKIIKMPTKKDIFFRFRIGDWFNPIRYMFGEIDKMTKGEKFFAYISEFSDLEKIFVIHPNRKSFSFIEEGSRSYLGSFSFDNFLFPYNKQSFLLSFRQRLRMVLLALRGYGQKYLTIPYFYNCYHGIEDVKYYCITPIAFPYEKGKILINIRDVFNYYQIGKNFSIEDNSFVWVGYPDELVLSLIKDKCVPYLKENNIKKIFVRFHPRDSLLLQKETISLFNKEGIETQIIEKNIIFEFVLLDSKNLTLMGYNSTLLYMAPYMNHKSIFFKDCR